ncbi:conserved hypothetical protein [Trichinella spiralis]|uniref:hypothetical protein n=1 Tax=Trichinella spiralis TaxID=6334 RepID=UPI0001EFB829|nr:conserved hypothetical protein [Trichinella spiralis]
MSASEYERREAVRRKILADAEKRMARVLGKTVNKSEDASATKQPTVSGSSANDDSFGGSGGYPFPSSPRFQVNLDDKQTAANFGFEPQRDVILFFIGIFIRYFVIVFRSAQVIILWLVFDFVWQQFYPISRTQFYCGLLFIVWYAIGEDNICGPFFGIASLHRSRYNADVGRLYHSPRDALNHC